MQQPIRVYDRHSQKIFDEKVYGGVALKLLYARNFPLSWLSKMLRALFCRSPIPSKWYGWLQKHPFSRRKVVPFIAKFKVNESEFLKDPNEFGSFNDFFIRKLKVEARPINVDPNVLTLPCDGRFLALPNAYESGEIWAKGQPLNIKELLGHREDLIQKFDWGSALVARLAPVDYHRFHFPCDCTPSRPEWTNGYLYSVNPIALSKNIRYLTQNKRCMTLLETERFGTIAYIEIGATYVGTICQTYVPGMPLKKGDEKGYFSFGGSSLILLFEQDRIIFSQDLVDNSEQGIETYARMGEVMALPE